MARTLTRRRRRSDDYDPTPDEPDDGDTYEEDEEDERPRGRRGRARRPRDEDDETPSRSDSRRPRSSRRGDEDDEDQESRRRPRGKSSGPTRSTAGSGWSSFDKQKDANSDFAKELKIGQKAILIKVLDAEPFSVYQEHWLDERKGKKSFVCLGDDCPLCDDLADKPRVYALFNVVDFTDPDDPEVKVWKVSRRLAGTVKNYAEDKKTSPLNRDDLYWSLMRTTGKGGAVDTTLSPVKARDVDEDWEIDPLTDEEIEEFEGRRYAMQDALFIQSRKDLKAIAAEYDD